MVGSGHPDLPRHRRVRRPVVDGLQHTALDLTAGQQLLDERLGVVLVRQAQRRVEVLGLLDPGDPDTRPAAGGLDEDRRLHRADLGTDRLPRAMHGERTHRQPARGEQHLHVLLVHRDRAGQHT